MRKDTLEMLNRVFNENGGFATKAELNSAGISDYFIRQFQANGIIERIKHGLYKLTETDLNEYEELITVSLKFPKGVICLLSALQFHELTTYTSWKVFLAVPRSYRVPSAVLTAPPTQIVHFSKKQYETGIQRVDKANNSFMVYDMEKSICDIIRYKDKYGTDIMKETLKTYVNRKDKDLSRLVKYAKLLRVKDIEKYLEVII